MDSPTNNWGVGEVRSGQWKLYRDLRGRNKRRAERARLLDAQRRRRIERVMQIRRERSFRQGG